MKNIIRLLVDDVSGNSPGRFLRLAVDSQDEVALEVGFERRRDDNVFASLERVMAAHLAQVDERR